MKVHNYCPSPKSEYKLNEILRKNKSIESYGKYIISNNKFEPIFIPNNYKSRKERERLYNEFEK